VTVAVDPLQAIRDIALGFPEATERETWGHPTFRVRDKIFVNFGYDESGRSQITLKAAPGEQESLLAEGEPFFVPKYVGSKGWIGVRVGADTDWREIGELVADSYREIAPKSLSAGIGLRPGPRGPGARMIVGVGNVIGELIEGKPPKDEVVAEQQADDDVDDDELLDLEFDFPDGNPEN
jgi:predicted DNA-binding protein (MmcQ/YjbR family)